MEVILNRRWLSVINLRIEIFWVLVFRYFYIVIKFFFVNFGCYGVELRSFFMFVVKYNYIEIWFYRFLFGEICFSGVVFDFCKIVKFIV